MLQKPQFRSALRQCSGCNLHFDGAPHEMPKIIVFHDSCDETSNKRNHKQQKQISTPGVNLHPFAIGRYGFQSDKRCSRQN